MRTIVLAKRNRRIFIPVQDKNAAVPDVICSDLTLGERDLLIFDGLILWIAENDGGNERHF